ncbi:FAD-dependent oxidoreductase [Mycobacteroides abscessus]|uniref:FAD-dependent oxidoreductase n=1 Tax=Mycobacteroides abscessus TaxID=36809 RepID=UPI00092BB19D|nr:FAD-dependent oxidoreductase [Mycobacteroides abscessus]SHQ88945.1 amine oxidase [Mycobacteroides abscessus subsp. bolletii]SHR74045.1 amine oxidase [Mycobacteroides abscessus subsp. bolletii]SHT17331.1 amine oxidase [Mycobacteroides abscessus subsp. bolletii]SKG04763.1 amine oxidase [Mycobacteroides abscessus subsp. bolletii]SKG72167.1 amine oxidase [Mycobacteroides abscessus subsp. bolletii]
MPNNDSANPWVSAIAARRVAVFGGGPAGLTVAHELVERGFEVDLYERAEVLGGKVRSFTHPGTGVDGRADLPGNMGGHFFISSYPNLGDTLSRIPFGEAPGSVVDNLTTGAGGLKLTLGWQESAVRIPVPSAATPLPAFLQAMRRDSVREALAFLRLFTIRDLVLLASKSFALVTCGPQRAWTELEHLALPQYLGAARLSARARRAMSILGPFGFENADGANARGAWQLANFELGAMAGRRDNKFAANFALLNGPENHAWIDPWRRHLESCGVRFHLRNSLTSFSYSGGKVDGASVRDADGRESRVEADWYVLAVPPGKAIQVLTDQMLDADPALRKIALLQEIQMFSVQILLTHSASGLRTLFTSLSSPWQTANEVLTSVWNMDLTQYGDGEAVEFVSVQVDDASWRHLPGMLYGKPAKDCTPSEIVEEILAQLRKHLPDGESIFAENAIHSVHFSPGVTLDEEAGVTVDEPLLACSPSCWENQPEPVTKIRNFFLAGSYTRNAFPGDTMDGANESGKRAANGVIAAAGAPVSPVRVAAGGTPRMLRILQRYDDRRYAAGKRNLFEFTAFRKSFGNTDTRPDRLIDRPTTTRSGRPVPARFLGSPRWARAVSTPLRLLLGGGAEPSAAELMDVAESLTRYDELGDDVARGIQQDKTISLANFAEAIEHGLERVPEPDPALVKFFAALEDTPEWVDWDLLEQGAEVCRRGGTTSLDVMGQALLAGYRSASTPNVVLVRTGALTGPYATKRVGETTKWWYECVQPGGMRRDGAGWKLTAHVRVMHALVNRKIQLDPEWDATTWGAPINQSDHTATYLLFCAFYIQACRALGYPITAREGRAVMHLWRYIGWLMGVENKWLADTEREGLRLIYHHFLAANKPGPEAGELSLALLRSHRNTSYSHRWQREFAYQRQLSISSLFLQRRGLAELGLPFTVPWFVVYSIAKNLVLHFVSRLTPSGKKGLERRQSEAQRVLVTRYFPDGAPRVGPLRYTR